MGGKARKNQAKPSNTPLLNDHNQAVVSSRRRSMSSRLLPPQPEQASSGESSSSQLNVHAPIGHVQSKERPHAASSTDANKNNTSPDKRKYETGNHPRRFSRFFRTSSPGKRSPPKKARVERRRSTGTGDHPSASVPHAGGDVTGVGGRGSLFVRRNASLGNEPAQTTTATEASNSNNTVVMRRRSLFRRRNWTKQSEMNPPGVGNNEAGDTPEQRRGEEEGWQANTHIIAVRSQSPRAALQEEKKEEREPPASEAFDTERTMGETFLCQSTEIFQHSYLETLCGVARPQGDSSGVINEGDPLNETIHIPDDPTVQESIECVFSTRLEEDIARMLQIDDDEEDEIMLDDPLRAPSQFHQSVLRTRSDVSLSIPPNSRARKRVESVKLAHMGSFRQGQSEELVEINQDTQPTAPKESPVRLAPVCTCTRRQTPQLDLSMWPQAPLLMRPTPGSGTRAKRVRLIGSGNSDGIVLWQAGQDSKETWWQALHRHWGRSESSSTDNTFAGCSMCPKCMVLPINNGNEDSGETLVTDFESDLFEGTLLVRLRYSNGTTRAPYRDDRGYFSGMNRRYQTVIRGSFKKCMSWTDCRTGLVLDRPTGRLPAKWILKGGIKVLSFFAPHLEVKLDSARPTSLTPLGSTPQVLAVHSPGEPFDMEALQEEPTSRNHCLLGEASSASSSLQRARWRKKSFDKLYAHRAREPRTDPSKVYTFEFLQHLFNFQNFSIELGSMLGSVPLAPMLNGQALPILACDADIDHRLWSFDVWHESLVSKKC